MILLSVVTLNVYFVCCNVNTLLLDAVGPPKPTEVEASKVTSTSATISWRLDLSKLHSDTAWKYKIQSKDGGKEQVTELKPVSQNPMSILVDPCTEYE